MSTHQLFTVKPSFIPIFTFYGLFSGAAGSSENSDTALNGLNGRMTSD
jgi:hypothetical protein